MLGQVVEPVDTEALKASAPQGLVGSNPTLPTIVSVFLNLPAKKVEAAAGFEPAYGGFADPCLASWLRRHISGAGDGT